MGGGRDVPREHEEPKAAVEEQDLVDRGGHGVGLVDDLEIGQAHAWDDVGGELARLGWGFGDELAGRVSDEDAGRVGHVSHVHLLEFGQGAHVGVAVFGP